MTYHNEKYGLGEGLGDLIGSAAIVGISTAGVRAYKNHKARTGNSQEALYAALLTARRWWLWAIAVIILGFASVVMWFGMIMVQIGNWNMHHCTPGTYNCPEFYAWNDVTPREATLRFTLEALTALTLSWVVIWTIYCRNVDSGLHKRGWIYRLFKPLYKLTMKVPSFFLYLSIPMFLLFL